MRYAISGPRCGGARRHARRSALLAREFSAAVGGFAAGAGRPGLVGALNPLRISTSSTAADALGLALRLQRLRAARRGWSRSSAGQRGFLSGVAAARVGSRRAIASNGSLGSATYARTSTAFSRTDVRRLGHREALAEHGEARGVERLAVAVEPTDVGRAAERRAVDPRFDRVGTERTRHAGEAELAGRTFERRPLDRRAGCRSRRACRSSTAVFSGDDRFADRAAAVSSSSATIALLNSADGELRHDAANTATAPRSGSRRKRSPIESSVGLSNGAE